MEVTPDVQEPSMEEQTVGVILALSSTPDLLPPADFSLWSKRVVLPYSPDQVEQELSAELRTLLRDEMERQGYSRARLVYPLNECRRVIDLETGAARWAGEGRPDVGLRGSPLPREPSPQPG